MFLTQKRHFTAHTLVNGLLVFVLLGGALSAYWSWSLQQIDASYRQTMATQQQDIDRLKIAIPVNRARNAPADSAMAQDLQRQRDELQRREQLLVELRQGLSREGWGHSERLLLVAKTIPSQAWVTEIHADDRRFELSGFTLEPSALNVWMARLAQSPLLQDQQLANVKVERAQGEFRSDNPVSAVTPVAMNAPKPAQPAVWSYNIVSAVATAISTDTNGSKP